MHGPIGETSRPLGPGRYEVAVKSVQPLLVVVTDRGGRVQPFADPDEGVEVPPWPWH
ncbi:hypothetical protein [Streptomyces sp. NPDC048565]|uniref:hypothetical protein n=1 Tax=Streptomyces sp. NPDC048565 TaxID=3155266 RepID=UPI0034406A8A